MTYNFYLIATEQVYLFWLQKSKQGLGRILYAYSLLDNK